MKTVENRGHGKNNIMKQLANNFLCKNQSSYIYSAKPIEGFRHLLTKNKTPEEYNGKYFYPIITKDKDCYAVFNSKNIHLTPSTHRLFDILTVLFTEENRKKETPKLWVNLSIETFLNVVHDEDRTDWSASQKDKARRSINQDLDVLYEVSLTWHEKIRGEKETRQFIKRRICQGRDIKNNIISFQFATDFAEYLIHISNYIKSYPLKLFTLPNSKKYFTAKRIGNKLSLQQSMYCNVMDGKDDLISVKQLLKYCVDDTRESVIKDKQGNLKRYLVDPLNAGLNHLRDQSIINWKYCNSQKGRLTTKQENEILKYDMFITLSIQFEILNVPILDREVIKEKQEKRERKALKLTI